MEKQVAGFKFGKYRLTVVYKHGEISVNGRKYVLVRVRTNDGLEYDSIRLYGSQGNFIKQLLFEPEIRKDLGFLLSGDNLLTVNQVAKIFIVDPNTVYRWEREGKIQSTRLGTNRHLIRFNRDEVDRLLNSK